MSKVGSTWMTAEEAHQSPLWWQSADGTRGQATNPLAALRSADHSEPWDWADVSRLAQTTPETAYLADPVVVARFLVALTADEPPKRVLDPWAGLGVTLAALETSGRISTGIAIEINSEITELARRLWPGSVVTWRLGDAESLLGEQIGLFDVIVGSPPIGLPRAELTIPERDIRLKASKTYTMLVQAALTLAPNGLLAVVLPEGYFGPANRTVREALVAVGVHPTATFALPRRTFPTSIPMSLVVFTHHAHDQIFIGELDGATDFASVVANLRARRPGALPQLGRLVPITEFVSWTSVLRDSEIQRIASEAGLRPLPIVGLCVALHSPRRTGDPFDPHEHAVYLPKLGTSPAVTSLDRLVVQPHNYVQLVLNPEAVDPEYLAAFFNAPLGRKVREQLASGTTIPQISLSTLRAGTVYLPPSENQQRAAVHVDRTLIELRQAIGSLEQQLWEHPLAANRIEADLRHLLEGDGLEPWLESLPFPLASVLWRYQTARDAEERCRYVIHFFEAASVFLVDLHLSALQQHPDVLAKVARPRSPDVTYARSSIGIWTDLLSRLAKRTRELVADDASLALELFHVADVSRIEAISRKLLVHALKDEGAAYRRDWIGHPAVVGPAEWERREAQAEATLARIRDGLGDAFRGWELVRAGQGSNRGGVIATSVEYLVGTRSHFRPGSVKLRQWPEDGGLYMLEAAATLMLHLDPLFTFRHSPESVEDACYFYDRIQDGGVRWVSYHYESRPELVAPDPVTVELVMGLEALG